MLTWFAPSRPRHFSRPSAFREGKNLGRLIVGTLLPDIGETRPGTYQTIAERHSERIVWPLETHFGYVPDVHRSRGILTTVCLLLAVTACSSGTPTEQVAATPSPSSSSKPASSTPPSPTTPPPAPLAKITAACPVLGAIEFLQVIGRSDDLVANEGESERVGAGKAYRCAYEDPKGKYGKSAELFVAAIPGNQPPRATIDKLAKECEQPATQLPGIGEQALWCEIPTDGPDLDIMVSVGKRGHGETRVATLYLYKTRPDVYATLAKLFADRL